jgi:hypothetical protein
MKLKFFKAAVVFIVLFFIFKKSQIVDTHLTSEPFFQGDNLSSEMKSSRNDIEKKVPQINILKATSGESTLNRDTRDSIEEDRAFKNPVQDTEKKIGYKFQNPSEINDILKKSIKLEKMNRDVIDMPACYLGEYVPFIGKPDRHQVELFITASFKEHEGDPADLESMAWPLSKHSQFTVFSLGSPILKGKTDVFLSPDKNEENKIGFLVSFDKFLYQIFRESSEKLLVRLFQKDKGNWTVLTEFPLKIYEGSGQDCYYHRQESRP